MEAQDYQFHAMLLFISKDAHFAQQFSSGLFGTVRFFNVVADTVSEPDFLKYITLCRHCIAISSQNTEHNAAFLRAVNDFERARNSDSPTAANRRFVFIELSGNADFSKYKEAVIIDDLRRYAIRSSIPLSVPDGVWRLLIGRVAMLVRSKPEEEDTANTAAQEISESNGPLAKPERTTLALDEARKRYPLFHSSNDIIDHAQNFGPKGTLVLSTGRLLAAVADRGTVMASPTWAAAWLRTKLGEEANTRLKERVFEAALRAQEMYKAEASVLTEGAEATLQHAVKIASRTSGADEIRVRHLVAALLTDNRGPENSGALGDLTYVGQDIRVLRESFFEFVRGYGDDDDAWGDILLGAQDERRILPGFDADSDKGEDQLDIKPDVLAFAGLIAARSLKPPLSIGLFGEWGSGKTFFMRMLTREVARLSREAREQTDKEKKPQREQTFYRRIVQVEFNAWHYAEGNLWASLVQHIFDNLRIVDDAKKRIGEELQEAVLQKLEVEKAAEVQAIRERDKAKVQRDDAEKALGTAKTEFEKKAQELARISSANVLADIPTDDIKTAFAPVLAALGLNQALDRGVELKVALVEARAMLNRGSAALVPLMSSPDRGRRWIFLILAFLTGPVAALLAAAVARWIGAEGMSNIAAAAGGVAVFLGSVTAWLKQQVTWVGDQLKSVETAQRKFDKSTTDAEAENLRKLREAQEQLRLLEADYVAATQRKEEAHRRVLEAEVKVREAAVPRLLSAFIEARANSTDYRKHLGMLALVRNDFEKLSDMIGQENEDLDRDPKADRRAFATLNDELANEKDRINRIVLYIDDLDRCPPAKVVEVLQAVHLLLAFPLFVVVVGVDARWVVRSLEARYRELLWSKDRLPDADKLDEFKELFGNASAHDYVEKIFQVPFWLKPMTDDASRRLVRDLLKGSLAKETKEEEEKRRERELEKREKETGAGKGERLSNMRTEGSDAGNGKEGGAGSGVGNGGAAGGREQDSGGGEHPVQPDLSPEGLSISRAELDFMSALAPLLGRSPRALKRFVNVYRLIRVGLSPWERQLFLSEAHGLAHYRAVLFLLAIDTGSPRLASIFFETLRDFSMSVPEKSTKKKSGIETLVGVLQGKEGTEGIGEEWWRVRGWLLSRSELGKLPPDDVARLARWIPRVSRFSFHTGRL